MSGFLQIAVVGYAACVAQQSRLCWRLLPRALEFPAFTSLSLLSLISSSVMFPLFCAWQGGEISTALYAAIFWKFRTMQIVLACWSLSEAMPFLLLGMGFGAVFELTHSLDVHRGLAWGFAIAAAILATQMRRESRLILWGIAIASLFPAISETSAVIYNGELLRFVPTFSFLAAQILWLRAFPRESDALTLSRKGTLYC